ncbi:integrase/recombinase XerD [Propionicimonas paludicola]|uniref:Tyrosine recombinase XerD n=1 Tax=Propionicimonas paludicola TaxID=185243 RepID=A0A2A9CQ16_9ACTN|nr:site-specific tyrosine recombinase XerD [Propionicimonas paludicola]PFG16514.1 integrase/recombinase XerD [Propionicimonas paludicola]
MATPVERLIRSYLDHLAVERGASPHTQAGYGRDLRRYAGFLTGRGITDPESVTEADVAAFVAELQTAKETSAALSVASASRALAAVRSLHAFAVRDGLTVADPAAGVHPPKAVRRLPKALSVDQVQALLDTPDPNTATGLRDAALLELLYGTGARISEVIALDVDELTSVLAEPDAGLRLFGKGRKERIVPVGSYARAAVEAWLVRGRPQLAQASTRPSPALLLNAKGQRLSRQSAWQILQKTAVAAHLDVEVSPHTLRHSFATHLLDGGADVRVVQELLGHASVTTTQIYTLVTAEHLREVFLTSHPRAR